MSHRTEDFTPEKLEQMRQRAGQLIGSAKAVEARQTEYGWATYTTLELILPNGDGLSFQMIKRRKADGKSQD